MVSEKNFRDDLYHRLNVVSLSLPPLRSLGEDVLVIAEQFLKIFNVEFKKKVKGFTSAAKSALLHYHWPGNVRELSNCLERAMIFIENDERSITHYLCIHTQAIQNCIWATLEIIVLPTQMQDLKECKVLMFFNQWATIALDYPQKTQL